MNQPSDHVATAQIDHPDLDEATDRDEHGPMFPPHLEGLDADDLGQLGPQDDDGEMADG